MPVHDLHQHDLFPIPVPGSFDELRALFPYQFNGPNIGHSLTTGWFPIFARLCLDIDRVLGADKQGFHWEQLKEKYGAARWYPAQRKPMSPEQEDTRKAIRTLIDEATSKARRACIVCGHEAHPYVGPDEYMLQLCEGHGEPFSRQGGDALPVFWM